MLRNVFQGNVKSMIFGEAMSGKGYCGNLSE